jgi:dinuclear metal center YbgI/SA1388 family protein
VADEAVAVGAQLVITHHPILFRGAKRLTADSPEGRTVLTLARAGISVYSPHTGFDNGPGGINDQIAARLELRDVRPLRPAGADDACKVVVFVAEADLDRVADAAFAAGAGVIGNYSGCGFRTAGVGTFIGGDGANPVIGRRGRREEVPEFRFEAVCPRGRLDAVVRAVRAAHSYEEPAIDVYPLVPCADDVGEGRIGLLESPTTLAELAGRVKGVLRSGPVQFVGPGERRVRSVAVACGAAGEFVADARSQSADAFVTGEMRFHDLLAAQAADVGVVLPGHYATERFAVVELAAWLTAQLPGVVVSASAADSDPVSWVV